MGYLCREMPLSDDGDVDALVRIKIQCRCLGMAAILSFSGLSKARVLLFHHCQSFITCAMA